MKEDFRKYPDVILLDATYKLNNCLMPLYVMLCVDGNGASQLAMICLTVSETQEAITKMIQTFKKHNPAWQKVRFAMTDKDMVERSVIKSEMPQVELGLCLFHTLRSFKREVTTSKMGISEESRDLSLRLLQSMAYAQSSDRYEQLLKEFEEAAPQSVVEYIHKNWTPIKREWISCYKSWNYNLGETTTNRVESWNAKIKEVCTTYSTLYRFFKDFISLIKTLRNERLHKLVTAQVRVDPNVPKDLNGYYGICTPHAFELIKAEFSLSLKGKGGETQQNYITTISSCSCLTFTSKSIPCRHIFSQRCRDNLPLFEETLVVQRWTKAYLMEGMSSTFEQDDVTTEASASITKSKNRYDSAKSLSEIQKYRLAHDHAQQICIYLSHMGTSTFRKNVSQLKRMADLLAHGKEFMVIEVVKETGMPFNVINASLENIFLLKIVSVYFINLHM